MESPLALPLDTRECQCTRAADYMAAYPGCTLRELASGADLGSASKVISEMERRFGYRLRKARERVATKDGAHSRGVLRYTLESRPSHSQQDLFPTE